MVCDFNLKTDNEPAKSQLARLVSAAGLTDSCTEQMCPSPGNIDKILYRSSAEVTLEAKSWSLETQKFETSDGLPLSDHEPLAMRFTYHTTK